MRHQGWNQPRRWRPLLAALAAAAMGTATAGTMPAVTLKVVDEQTGAPLQGVTAMLWETAHRGNLSGHGGTRLVLFANEAASDQSGELRFEPQQFDDPPVLSLLHAEGPMLLLLKPGFAPLVLDKDYQAAHGVKDGAVWDRPGATVSMKPGTNGSHNDEAADVYIHTRDVLEPAEKCAWQRVPNTLVTEYRMYHGLSTLVALQMLDARYAQACGSPRAFFQRYGIERASPFETVRPSGVIKALPAAGVSATARAARPAGTD